MTYFVGMAMYFVIGWILADLAFTKRMPIAQVLVFFLCIVAGPVLVSDQVDCEEPQTEQQE